MDGNDQNCHPTSLRLIDSESNRKLLDFHEICASLSIEAIIRIKISSAINTKFYLLPSISFEHVFFLVDSLFRNV
jgi:hypothetical protein